MSISRVVENLIREAIAEGKFDNLPGAGKRLDLEEYFSTPEDLRMAYSILKNARIAPAEVELLKEIARIKQTLEQTHDDAERRSLQQVLADRKTELAVRLERRSRQPR